MYITLARNNITINDGELLQPNAWFRRSSEFGGKDYSMLDIEPLKCSLTI